MPIPRRCQEQTKSFPAVRRDPQVHVAVAADLLARDVDLDQASSPRNHPAAFAAGKEPEARSENQDQIGLTGVRAIQDREVHGAAAAKRMICGDEPVCAASREHGDPCALCEGHEIGGRSREPGPSPGHDDGTFCRMQPVDDGLDRIGGRGGGRLRPDLLGEKDPLLVHLREGDIDRNLEVHGAGSAGGRDTQCLPDEVRNPIDLGNAVGPLGDGRHQRQLVVSSRESQPLVLAQRTCAADQEHRDCVDVGVDDAADGIGDARSGGHDCHARSTCGARPSIRCLNGSLLVPCVGHAEAVRLGRHQDRVEMPSVQREELPNPRVFEHPYQYFAAVQPTHDSPPLAPRYT